MIYINRINRSSLSEVYSLLENLAWLWLKLLAIMIDFFSFALDKIMKFHLIYWCENVVERHSFSWVSSDSSENLRKLCLSTIFLHQEIRWNFWILRIVGSIHGLSCSGLIYSQLWCFLVFNVFRQVLMCFIIAWS